MSLNSLGIGPEGAGASRREVFRLFARHWHLFLGTPSLFWIEHLLGVTFGIDTSLGEDSADEIYDVIADKPTQQDFRSRALLQRFGIEVLATTDSALDDLSHHRFLRLALAVHPDFSS